MVPLEVEKVISMSENKKNIATLEKDDVILNLRDDTITVEDVIDKWFDDKEVGLEIIQKHSAYIKRLSPRLKDDKDILLIAVKKNPYALYHGSERMQEDLDLLEILEAEKDNIHMYSRGLIETWYKERLKFFNLKKEIVESEKLMREDLESDESEMKRIKKVVKF